MSGPVESPFVTAKQQRWAGMTGPVQSPFITAKQQRWAAEPGSRDDHTEPAPAVLFVPKAEELQADQPMIPTPMTPEPMSPINDNENEIYPLSPLDEALPEYLETNEIPMD